MPTIQSILNTPVIDNLLVVIKRQAIFVKNTKTIRTWQYMSVDYNHQDLKYTLLQMISNISWDDELGKTRQLILSTDNHYNNDGLVLTVHPKI